MFNKLAPFACDADHTRGREYVEADNKNRSPFQRDRDRIIHAGAFRRLKHKTQVFVYHTGDYYRTRLTHSLEVSQIARSICRTLRLDEDLTEAVSLAHDLGHTPFGHAGEEALDQAMKPWGGFDHNAQTLRILTRLEHRYAEFDGLNLTWETLEGVVKHNGPITGPLSSGEPVNETIQSFNNNFNLELDTFPSTESQVAAVADDIAYHNHDIDDGLRAGLFSIADLMELPLIGAVVYEVIALYGSEIERSRLANEIVRRTIDRMVINLIDETRRRIAKAAPASAKAVRNLGYPIVGFSDQMERDNKILKDFLYNKMYHHPLVTEMTTRAQSVVKDLFNVLCSDPDTLPEEWKRRLTSEKIPDARLVADYVAGMTDRYALHQHKDLCGRSV